MPVDGIRWTIALDTGWPLEYIDTLSERDMISYMAYKQGASRASKRG